MRHLQFLLLIVGTTLISCSSFDSEKWKNDKTSRKSQAKSIIKNRVLVNKTYYQVREMLGPEDFNSNFKDTITYDGTFEYILGTYWIDFDRLTIRFKKGHVDSVYRYHD